jgi:FixJ family two-component response regulator
MPNMSGPDMAREIQTLHPGIKVIFVSGYHTGFDALPEGAVLLTKPFGPKDILNAVNDLLTRQ